PGGVDPHERDIVAGGAAEPAGQAGGVVEGFQDLDHSGRRDAPLDGPADDVEVLPPGRQAVEYPVQQECVVGEPPGQQAEVAAVQLDPELVAPEVLQPAGTQEATPVQPRPAAEGRLAQVEAGPLALDPLVAEGLPLAL